MNRISLIFNTCDSYIDLSDNFFLLLKKYWPEFNGRVFYNADTKYYNNRLYNIVNVEHTSNNDSWSQRLYDSLKLVNTEYVILFLDDFYLEGRVNQEEFLKCLNYIDSHKDVNSIVFTREPGRKKSKITELGDFCYRKHFSTYKVTAHIGIYRVDFLKNILKRDENAWQFELNGTVRSFFTKGKFICKTNKQYTFPYHYGLLVRQGKYDRNLKSYFETKEMLTFPVERPFVEKESSSSGGFLRKIIYVLEGLFSVFSSNPS